MWDHAEVNPFVKGSGTLIGMNGNILNGLEYSIEKLKARGEVHIVQTSITGLKESGDIIVADPLYFDDVQYAELCEFFLLWERKALLGCHDLGDVPKVEDMSVGKEALQRHRGRWIKSDTAKKRSGMCWRLSCPWRLKTLKGRYPSGFLKEQRNHSQK